MNISLAALTYEQLNDLQTTYREDKSNLLAQSACCQHTLGDVLVDRKTRFSSLHVFNTKVLNIFVSLTQYDMFYSGLSRRTTSDKSKIVRSLLDICLFECYASATDEDIENI